MANVNYFKDSFESVPDYRKIVLLMFLIKNNIVLLAECGLLKSIRKGKRIVVSVH